MYNNGHSQLPLLYSYVIIIVIEMDKYAMWLPKGCHYHNLDSWEKTIVTITNYIIPIILITNDTLW